MEDLVEVNSDAISTTTVWSWSDFLHCFVSLIYKIEIMLPFWDCPSVCLLIGSNVKYWCSTNHISNMPSRQIVEQHSSLAARFMFTEEDSDSSSNSWLPRCISGHAQKQQDWERNYIWVMGHLGCITQEIISFTWHNWGSCLIFHNKILTITL